MQKGLFICNKETQTREYLQHRSLLDITEEHRTLTEMNKSTLSIIDVDLLLYIYYKTDDPTDMQFRADANALRNLLSTAFFNVDRAIFIFVNCDNAMLEDMIMSSVRNSNLSRDSIDIIHHSGTLMLQDIGTYVTGGESGENSNSSFKSVYIREADKEEKDRYVNTGSDLNTVMPALTDMVQLYTQRAHTEAIAGSRVISESAPRPETVDNFTYIDNPTADRVPMFVISGEQWTESDKAINILLDYLRTIGRRVLIVNLDNSIHVEYGIGDCVTLTLQSLKTTSTPSKPIAVLPARFNQLGYILELMSNIGGVETIIYYCAEEDYAQMVKFVRQLSEDAYAVFVAHYSAKSVQKYIDTGTKSTALFLTFKLFHDSFDLESYRDALAGTTVAQFPISDYDPVEFYDFATGR